MEDQNQFNPYETPSPMRMAGFGPRWGAILIDVNIMVLGVILLFRLFGSVMSRVPFNIFDLGGLTIVSGILLYMFGLPVLWIFYHTLFDCSMHQGSPGKIAVRIKVTDVYGQRISFSKALVRNASKILSSIIFYIGYFMAIWTEKRQALHDIIADTYVVIKD